jgi:2-methylcitrate dehydratase PrpD
LRADPASVLTCVDGSPAPPPGAPAARSPLTRTLAQFVAGTGWADIPAAVRHEAKRSLVNYFAAALAGCSDTAIERAAAVYGRFRAGDAAALIGRTQRTDSLNAAALNAMSANIHDFDDTHVPTIIHPTAPVAAALFALAGTAPLSGPQLLLALVLGIEIECRLGNAVSPGHYRRGWHITSTCGVFGAAAAAAKAMNLAAARIVWAYGNASAQSAGLIETLGTMAKSLSVGNAARNGLLSALLAAADFSGPEQPIEGARGFLRVTCDAPDFGAVTGGLGSDWALLSNTYKPYPCAIVLHPVIDACLALARLASEPGASWTLGELERLEVAGHPLLRERTDRPDPACGREAQVSVQHAVAVALARGRAGLAEFADASVADPALRQLGGRVVLRDDPGCAVESAQVRLVLRSGQTISQQVSAARGSLARPLTDGELDSKLRELAAYSGSGIAAQPLLDALWGLEDAADAAEPMRLAQRRGS